MFVTEEYLKDETPMGDNVDIKKVMPWVKSVLRTNIEPILGRYFLNKLIERYVNSTTTPEDDELIDMIKPALAWRAVAHSIISTTFKLKNKGLQKQFGDFSQSASFEEVTFNVDHYNQNSTLYEEMLLDFLCDNIDEYPEAMDKKNKKSKVYGKCCISDDEDGTFNESFMVI